MGELVSKCPVCGEDLEVKEVEKVVTASFREERCSNRSLDESRKPVTSGSDAAILTVEAGVCHRCGERVYGEGDYINVMTWTGNLNAWGYDPGWDWGEHRTKDSKEEYGEI